MNRTSPILGDDADIYSASAVEVNFALNARKLLDGHFGERFDEAHVKNANLVVGLFLHTNCEVRDDDEIFENFFSMLRKQGVNTLFSLPTGYPYADSNAEAMEVVNYDPPLIGKISPEFEGFAKIRGGQIGLYSSQCHIFAPALDYALLDWNGGYSLFLGPGDFVEAVIETSIEKSWVPIANGDQIDERFLLPLRRAMRAYGYDKLLSHR